VLELTLAKNASLEEEAAGLRQALKLAEAAAAAYQDQLAGVKLSQPEQMKLSAISDRCCLLQMLQDLPSLTP
jgi:hypothetical protein